MARFTYDEVDHYGGQGGAGYFSLKNDGDVARVRFMYKDAGDIEGYAVHQVEIDGKKRWVNCLREYNEPLDKCPFCKDHRFQQARLFIPIYNIDEDRVQVWERGKKFFSQISSIASRYPDLVSHVFEIERNGKKGDTTTTYGIYEVDKDNTTLEDLPEKPQILGSVVLEKTEDELLYYLENGEFPADVPDVPVRRRDESVRRSEGGRRTPATGRREAF